jgi:CRP/FNR family transcriptional regulator, cyclic AMP receptor protein
MEWPLLAALSAEDSQSLLQRSRRRTFARGEVVFHRGDPADTLHLISKGRFAVRIVTPLGDSAVLSVLGPGEAFGELALLEGGAPRSATVAALEPAETRSIHKIDFDALRARNPAVTGVIVGALAADVRRLSDLLVDALYVPAETRVLRRLHDVCERYHDAGEEVAVPLTQEELAGLAGTSRATVNRVLRDAERRGHVRLSRGRVVVLERAALHRRVR